jgi:hypothetical protein
VADSFAGVAFRGSLKIGANSRVSPRTSAAPRSLYPRNYNGPRRASDPRSPCPRSIFLLGTHLLGRLCFLRRVPVLEQR